MSLLNRRVHPRPELPLVPLIDVLVMLVLFAYVTMQARSASTLNITVPKVQTAGQNEFTGKVEVGVSKEGTLTFNGRVISETDLEGLLAEVKKINKDTPILVRADEVSQFGIVTRVWDTCRRLGLNKVVMQTRR
ncbi:MAG: biopolymer transporter ExbD [Opitutaceae bacterium]